MTLFQTAADFLVQMLTVRGAAVLAISYLLGSIAFGLILTRLAGTQDLRSIGSGNIGATNVLRTGRKDLAEVIDHYYATRDFWIRKADDAAHGGIPLKPSNPRPADWTNPAAKGLAASLGRLVAQGYVTRSNFGWFPEDELKTVLNATTVERDACAGQRS